MYLLRGILIGLLFGIPVGAVETMAAQRAFSRSFGAGVFIGTSIWWCLLSAIVAFVKRKTGNHSLLCMNRVFGVILTMFGITVFIRTFL